MTIDISADFHPDIIGDAQDMQIQSESIDCVKCTELLEHVEYPEKVISEIHRILVPGGILVLSIPLYMSNIHADPYDYQRYNRSEN